MKIEDGTWLGLLAFSLPAAFYAQPAGLLHEGPFFVNAGLAERLGYESSAFVRDPGLWRSIILDEDLARIQPLATALDASGAMSVQYRCHAADGTVRNIFERANVISGRGGSGERRLLGVCLDMTESDGAIEAPDGEFRHEVNNLLTVISWNLDVVARAISTGTAAARAGTAFANALNGASLLRALLTQHGLPADESAVALGAFLPLVAGSLEIAPDGQFSAVASVDAGTRGVAADSAKLAQVLIELGFCAFAAASGAGRLTIAGANAGTHGAAPAVAITMSIEADRLAPIDPNDNAFTSAKGLADDLGGAFDLVQAGGTAELRLRLSCPS